MQNETNEEICERDGFVELFRQSHSQWELEQADQFEAMRFIVGALENLNQKAVSG